MNRFIRVKDLFESSLFPVSELSLVPYLEDYRQSFPFKYFMVERVNSRHYRLFVKRFSSELPSHDCRISANDNVFDIVKLALS